MRVLLILIFVISFAAKIIVLAVDDPNLNEIDAELLAIKKEPKQLDIVFKKFFDLQLKSTVENESIISLRFENLKESEALFVLQKSQEIQILKLHKASIKSGKTEKSYNLEIVYIVG